jgi:hypothetical protein
MESEPVLIDSIPVSNEADIEHELRRRGFIVLTSEESGDCVNYALTLSKRLVVKLSLQEEIPLKPMKKYTAYQSFLLANAALSIIERSTTISATAVWVAHNKDISSKLTTTTGNEAELTKLCNYFGPQISLQFAFIAFNRYHLPAMSVVGLMLFLEQVSVGALGPVWLYLYTIYLALWSSYHLQRWKQRQSSLLFLWGVLGADSAAFDAEWAKVNGNAVVLTVLFLFASDEVVCDFARLCVAYRCCLLSDRTGLVFCWVVI